MMTMYHKPILGKPGPTKDRHENAAEKKLCGTCGWKAVGKGDWRCTNNKGLHFGPDGGTFSGYICPAPEGDCPGFSKKPTTIYPPQPKKKALPVPPGVKFLYFGRLRGLKTCHLGPYPAKDGSREHQGVVTVAWISTVPGVLHLGFSFCSPKDSWCKATGRNMAAARLIKKTGPTVTIPFLYDANRTVHEVVRAVLNHDWKTLFSVADYVHHNLRPFQGSVPGWTKDLAKGIGVRRVLGISKLSRLLVEPITHMKDAFAFMAPFFDPPRKKDITFISTPRQVKNLFSKYCVEEPAEISFEAWERLKKVLKMGTSIAKPIPTKPTPQQIVARMMRDIAALGND